METGGWGGGVIALCFAFLSCYLGGFLGGLFFSCLCIVAGGWGDVGRAEGGGFEGWRGGEW